MNILVTGGASGLGESITRRLALEKEFNVHFTYNKSHSKALQLKAEFPNCFPEKCDFSNEKDVAALKQKIEQLDLDVLINNAYNGGFIQSYFHKTNAIDYLNAFKENIIPVIEITQVAINCFRKKKKGKIITILTAGLIDTPPIGSSVYISTKAYLQELVKIWAAENAKFNISSNAVSPSFMLTNLTAGMDERVIEEIKEKRPQKKLLTTEEVAEAVFSLIRKKPSELNGANIVVNSASDIK